jgi:ribosomal protein L29
MFKISKTGITIKVKKNAPTEPPPKDSKGVRKNIAELTTIAVIKKSIRITHTV